MTLPCRDEGRSESFWIPHLPGRVSVPGVEHPIPWSLTWQFICSHPLGLQGQVVEEAASCASVLTHLTLLCLKSPRCYSHLKNLSLYFPLLARYHGRSQWLHFLVNNQSSSARAFQFLDQLTVTVISPCRSTPQLIWPYCDYINLRQHLWNVDIGATSLVSDPSSHLLHHSSTRQIHWFPDTPYCISALYSHLTLDSRAQCYKHCFANTCSLMVSSCVLLTWYNSTPSGENQRRITLTWSLLVLQRHICPINTYSDYVTIENKKNEVHHILLKFLISSNKRHSAILPFIASIPCLQGICIQINKCIFLLTSNSTSLHSSLWK